MRTSFMIVLMTVLATLAGAPAINAQTNPHVRVQVLDSSGQPIPFVNVFRGATATLVADDSGRLTFASGRGIQRVELRRLGFEPLLVTLNIQRDTFVTWKMATAPRLLSAQRIVAVASDRLMRAGLYQRIKDVENGLRVGTFVTREEIELRQPSRISQMLDKAHGVTVYHGVPMASANNCPMTIYLDGARIDFGGAAGSSMAAGSPGSMKSMMDAMNKARSGAGRVDQERDSMDGTINPNEVAAIEIYSLPGSVPPMFQHLNGTCGVIAIWTR